MLVDAWKFPAWAIHIVGAVQFVTAYLLFNSRTFGTMILPLAGFGNLLLILTIGAITITVWWGAQKEPDCCTASINA
jgi:hypothetical protein